MQNINLRELYPDVYKTDLFVEVTGEVLETIRASERADAAYDRRMYAIKRSILWTVRMALKMQSYISRSHRNSFWRKSSCKNSFIPL